MLGNEKPRLLQALTRPHRFWQPGGPAPGLGAALASRRVIALSNLSEYCNKLPYRTAYRRTFCPGDQPMRRHSCEQPSNEVRVARLRRNVRERLGVPTDSRTESDALPLADAQLLVARSLGFKDWDQLVKDVGA
jgi:hypothetical protein